MRAEPSKLAQLVIAYYEKFGRHVPTSALRYLDAGELAAHLQDSLAPQEFLHLRIHRRAGLDARINSVPLSETGWGWPSMEYGLRGCILRVENPKRAPRRKKRRDGE
jgi:hypothetical protein